MTEPVVQICSNCSAENAVDAKFCQNCGHRLSIVCPNCAQANDSQAQFCKNCGTALSAAAPEDPSLEALRQSAPDELQAKVRRAMSEFEDERRPVTILFVDIVGSTSKAESMDAEDWREVVTGAHRRLSEAIYRYEGTIAQLLGDGLLAFFGAPITHEDDPSRAVHAGLDIQESIQAYSQELAGYVDDFQVRVGINTGTVVIGDVGEGMNVEYLAVGDAINVASRIESSAKPGTVWLGEDCARLVKSEFDLVDQGEFEVKGKADALRLYEVQGPRSDGAKPRDLSGPISIYVGRESELDLLHKSILDLCRGHGQIVVISGEAGIGKSRLLQEMRNFAEEYDQEGEPESSAGAFLVQPNRLRWLEGRSLSYGASLSFWSITRQIMADLGLKEGTPEARIELALRKRVRELFEEDSETVLPFLMHLFGLRLEGKFGDLVHSMDGETRRRETLGAITKYFSKLAEERPTILVFEDLHWADPSTLKAMETLLPLADRVPLMVLSLMRVERDHPSWNIHLLAETNYAHRYTEISLKKLTTHESARMVDELLGVADLPQGVGEFVMKRSEGNPLYVEEVIHHLVEHGYLAEENNEWRVTRPIDEVGVPDTLQGLLLARIDRQEEQVRRTLQLASVIGRSFMYRLLKAISDAERELDDHLAKLQRADLVREQARIPELEYMFKHSLTQEAAYRSLLVERRKEFHAKVAEAIEHLFDTHAEEFTGLLAYHWDLAGDVEKAKSYLIQAGERARNLHSHLEALNYFDRAIEFSEKDSSDYIALLRKRAQVHLDLFQGKAAVNDLDQICDFANRHDDDSLELEAHLGLGRAYYIVALDEAGPDAPTNSRSNFEEAYRLARALDDKGGMIRALIGTEWLQDFWPEYREQVVANIDEAVELSTGMDDEEMVLATEHSQFNLASGGERIALYPQLISKLEARQDLTRINMVHFMMMWTYLEQGDFISAVETCDAGIALAKRIGVPPVQYPTLKGWALMRMGRFDEAIQSFHEEVADADHRFGRVFKDFGLAITDLQLLSHRRALDTLRYVIGEAEALNRAWLVRRANTYIVPAILGSDRGDLTGLLDIVHQLANQESPRSHIAQGQYYLSQGDHAKALEMANAAYVVASKTTRQPEMVNALLLKTRALLGARQHEQALEAVDEALQIAREIGYRPLLWQLFGAKAEAHRASGRVEAAASARNEAAAVIRELSDHIHDAELQAGFLGHPLVAEILGVSGSE